MSLKHFQKTLPNSIEMGKINVHDFLFPFNTALALLLLDISDVLLTGNDYKIVSICRKLIETYNKKFSCNYTIPKLFYEKNDFLQGYNYKKMNINNCNCIFIDDVGNYLEYKLKKLFEYKYFSISMKHSLKRINIREILTFITQLNFCQYNT